MLGWHISVFRQTDGGSSPARADSGQGTHLAVWQTDLGGLDWLDELVKNGRAIDLGGDGYPNGYTAQAQSLIPQIAGGPPEARATWVYGPNDILTDQWEGRTAIDRAAADACRPDEWLLVVA